MIIHRFSGCGSGGRAPASGQEAAGFVQSSDHISNLLDTNQASYFITRKAALGGTFIVKRFSAQPLHDFFAIAEAKTSLLSALLGIKGQNILLLEQALAASFLELSDGGQAVYGVSGKSADRLGDDEVNLTSRRPQSCG